MTKAPNSYGWWPTAWSLSKKVLNFVCIYYILLHIDNARKISNSRKLLRPPTWKYFQKGGLLFL